MTLPPDQQMRREASLALRSGDLGRALEIYRQLQKRMPADPAWPERCAHIYHEMGEKRSELVCLRQALDLQVDAGQVLAAIATCKLILDIEPEHPGTLECLHLLYTEPSMNSGENVPPLVQSAETAAHAAVATAPDGDAPLLELELTEAIPGARAVQLGNAQMGRVTEIPLDETQSGLDPARPLDLGLEGGPVASPSQEKSPLTRATRDEKHRAAREALASTPLFGSLNPAALRELMAKARIVRLEAGAILFREGDPANTLYVVVDGAVVPIAERPTRKRLAVLERGEFFGEIGLVTNQPRNATIEALVDSRLLAIDRRVMWSLIKSQPKLSKVMLRFLRERLIDRHTRTSPFFTAFARDKRSELAREFHLLEVRDGTCVVEQGRTAEGLFILLAGQMRLIDSERDKPLGELAPGDLLGGIPLPGQHPASSSVVASGKCWLLVLDERRLRRIIEANPRLAGLLDEMARGVGE